MTTERMTVDEAMDALLADVLDRFFDDKYHNFFRARWPAILEAVAAGAVADAVSKSQARRLAVQKGGGDE